MRKTAFFSVIISVLLLAAFDLAFGLGGPHGNYASTSDKCDQCHNLHNSPATASLLKYSSIYDTCNFCHGVGGAADSEPYAHYPIGSAPGEHRPNEATSGGTSVGMSKPLPRPLSCASCHAPHGNFVIATYSCDTTLTATDHLLRRAGSPTVNPGALAGPGATYSVVYGNQWCSDCHDIAHGTQTNPPPHPTNTGSLTYASAGLARTNVNFQMYPVTTSGNFGTPEKRTRPLCMQCHEDARNVEVPFSRPLPDRQGATKTNPQYATFPHQTALNFFRLEAGDDLCMNCHQTSSLP